MRKRECAIPDCPEQYGGRCFMDMRDCDREVVRELRTTRQVYKNFKLDGLAGAEPMWWHAIINVLDDRIEQLTGSRV